MKQGRRLLAVVLDRNPALLPADARTVLLAALREVDAVTKATEGDWRLSLPEQSNGEVVADLESDAQRSKDFIEFVLTRQASAAPMGAGL